MFIRYFVEADGLKEARKTVEESMDEISDIIIYKKRKSVEPYWKIDGIYIVEFRVKVREGTLQQFLKHYSDLWNEYGEPIGGYNLIATDNIEDCKYIKGKFTFINLFLDDGESTDEFVITENGKERKYVKGGYTFINVF